MSQTKYYLEIPFVFKDQAKEVGCKWDVNEKKWYTHNAEHELFDNFSIVDLTNFKYDDKEYIKCNGGRYDAIRKTWYTYCSNEELKKYF